VTMVRWSILIDWFNTLSVTYDISVLQMVDFNTLSVTDGWRVLFLEIRLDFVLCLIGFRTVFD
jgi:hypothetical protein